MTDTFVTTFLRLEPIRKYASFLLLSALSFTINFSLTVGLTEFAGIEPGTAFAVALTTVFVVNFFVMRYVVYRAGSGSICSQLFRYVPSALLFRFAEQRVFVWIHELDWLPYQAIVVSVLSLSTLVKFFYWGTVVFVTKRGGKIVETPSLTPEHGQDHHFSLSHAWTYRTVLLGVCLPLLLFTGLLLVGICTHEMWRDETQVWAVARYSNSVVQLLTESLRYEGHPAAWYLLVYPLTRLTQDPRAMQILHAVIAVAVAGMILVKAPFPKWQRILLVLGYFPLYEWGVLARNYSLGALTLFMCLALYPERHKRLMPMALLLALLANSNVYGLLIALSMAGVLAIEIMMPSTFEQPKRQYSPPSVVLAGLIVFLGITVSVWTLMPPPDRWSGRETLWGIRYVVGAFAAIWNGYVPLPDFTDYHFWNTNIISMMPWKGSMTVRALLGLCVTGLGVVLLRRKPLPLLFFLSATGAIVVFTAFKWPGYVRHHGHFFLVLVAALWLAAYHRDLWPEWVRLPKIVKSPKLASQFLVTLAVLNICAAAWALRMDILYPFSDGQQAAAWLRSRGIDQSPIVGSKDYLISPLSTYLGTKIYYPELGAWGSSWTATNRRYRKGYDAEFALSAARQLAMESNRPTILALSQPLDVTTMEPGVTELVRFDQSFLSYESNFTRLEPEHFFLYRVAPSSFADDARLSLGPGVQ